MFEFFLQALDLYFESSESVVLAESLIDVPNVSHALVYLNGFYKLQDRLPFEPLKHHHHPHLVLLDVLLEGFLVRALQS